MATDVEGLLEVKASQLDDDAWVRTTDLARLDGDGFLFILGRADQAIIRGGFKVRPEDIKAALERLPAVRGAAVVSREDRRLGAVPVAVVELRPDAGPDHVGGAAGELSGVLARYELPEEIVFVDVLPRTDSGKVDLAAVHAELDAHAGGGEPVTARWTFGVDPLPQTTRPAALLREVTGLVVAVEEEGPAVEELIAALERAKADLGPRVAVGAPPRVGAAASGEGGCTSTTPSTSGPTTRASPSTRSRWSTGGRTARLPSPSPMRVRPDWSMADSWLCSSTVWCNTTTASSEWQGRRRRLRSATAAPRPC